MTLPAPTVMIEPLQTEEDVTTNSKTVCLTSDSTTDEVCLFLMYIKRSKYCKVFKENQVDGRTLQSITVENLTHDLHVLNPFDCQVILCEAQMAFQRGYQTNICSDVVHESQLCYPFIHFAPSSTNTQFCLFCISS